MAVKQLASADAMSANRVLEVNTQRLRPSQAASPLYVSVCVISARKGGKDVLA